MKPACTLSKNATLRIQLCRLVLLVSLLALGLAMVGGALVEWRAQREQVSQSLIATAQATGLTVSAAIVFRDGKAAGEALNILSVQKNIQAAAVYTPEGRRLASYGDKGASPETFAQLSAHVPDFGPWSASTTLFQPIVLDREIIGHIYLVASLLDYRASFLIQVFLSLIASLLGLLLANALAARFIDRIVTPLGQLADTARQVRESQNFSLRAAIPEANTNKDEIAELVLSFNAMLSEIEQRKIELTRYHSNLELMVQNRTEALHEANHELLLAKDAAEAATQAKSRFLAAASHDLRQPIQAINLFKNALDRTDLDEEQRRISNYLSRSVASLGELLDALLDISTLDSGVMVPKPARVDVHDLFCRIDEEFSVMATAKSLRFKLHFPCKDTALATDGELLHSLLRNLIGNAIKYTERGGVLVSLRRRGTQALIQVWDTGIGIAPEHSGNIFDEYFQVANPERDKAKGLGLGLAITKRLAKLLNTDIVCHSQPGRGSVFGVSVPLASSPQGDELSPCELGERCRGVESALVGRHVAIIEDDTMVAKALQVSLELLGMQATVYGSAEDALADAGITDAEFYISDYRLPGANGIQLLEAIQQRRKHAIRALLVTGEKSPGGIDLTQSSRWPVLSKPVALPTLIAALEAQVTAMDPCPE